MRFAFGPIAITLSILSLSGPVLAERADVQFAGFAITGDAAGENSSVQILAPALQGEAAVARNRALLAAVQAIGASNVQLNTDGLAALDGSTSAIAVAAAIDRESVLVETIGDDTKLVVEIAGQALFFDFREKQVIASVPVTVQHIDVVTGQPDDAMRAAALQRLLDDSGEAGFSAAMAKAIAGARLPGPAARRIQLTTVEVAPGALDGQPMLQARANSGVIGHEFSKYFAAGTGLALLPYRSGQAIGGAMAARFADGSVFTLQIPEPDYAIQLRVDRIAQRAAEKSAALERRLYGVFFTLVVEEPLSGKRYFDQALRHGATKLIPATQASVDDGAAYYDTLLDGFASFAAASQGEADTWVSEQSGGRDARSQWNELKELIEQCR